MGFYQSTKWQSCQCPTAVHYVKKWALPSAGGTGGDAAPQPLTFKSGKLSRTDELVAEFIYIQLRSSASGFWAACPCPLLIENMKRWGFLALSLLGRLNVTERRPSLHGNKQTGAHYTCARLQASGRDSWPAGSYLGGTELDAAVMLALPQARVR